MEKELTISLLDEIIKHCEAIKQIKEESSNHTELKKILKENYNLTSSEIETFLNSLAAKSKSNFNNKEIEKINSKIESLCSLVNISFKNKNSDQIDYSKIRSRVSSKKSKILNKKISL